MSLPWIEKYRPRKIDQLIINDTIHKKIMKMINDLEMPNLVITGIPGIGKTTTIKCLVHHLYGPHVKDAVLELNASDDRGIKTVQETITNFCKKKLDLNRDKKLYADHKIIILDEADNMTPKAQITISNLMEKYYDTTRFAFTCNSSADIIECIQSRCNIIRYIALTPEQMVKRLMHICKNEKVEYELEALNTIASISQGDIRTAINNLQLIYNCHKEILDEYVYRVCDKPQPDIINKIFVACLNKNLNTALKIFYELKNQGYVESDIILNMIFIIKSGKTTLTEPQKNIFMNIICNYAYIISKGFDSPLQMAGCISDMILSIE